MSTLFTNIRTRIWAKDIERDLIKMDSLVRKTSDVAQLTSHSFLVEEGGTIDGLDTLAARSNFTLAVVFTKILCGIKSSDSAGIDETMAMFQQEINAIASFCDVEAVSLDSSSVVLDSANFVEVSLLYDSSFLVLNHLDSVFTSLEDAFNRLNTERLTNLLSNRHSNGMANTANIIRGCLEMPPGFRKKHVVLAREEYKNGDAFVVELTDREKSLLPH